MFMQTLQQIHLYGSGTQPKLFTSMIDYITRLPDYPSTHIHGFTYVLRTDTQHLLGKTIMQMVRDLAIPL